MSSKLTCTFMGDKPISGREMKLDRNQDVSLSSMHEELWVI
jgi:hypothetical protein